MVYVYIYTPIIVDWYTSKSLHIFPLTSSLLVSIRNADGWYVVLRPSESDEHPATPAIFRVKTVGTHEATVPDIELIRANPNYVDRPLKKRLPTPGIIRIVSENPFFLVWPPPYSLVVDGWYPRQLQVTPPILLDS